MLRQERTKSGTGIYHVMFGMIDDLTISYDGNRLVKVTDAAEALNYSDALDFNDGADTECEYEYDSNGALTKDSNRGIKSITYDYGHHPSYINMNIGRKVRYAANDYTPDGRKLSSKHKTFVNGNIAVTTTDLYVDGLMLRNGAPLLWQFDGGYVDLNDNGTPTSWNDYVTDHLGSTRMVVDSNDNIKETISYYPFGSEMRMENPAQMQQTDNNWHPFRFTGKELDRQNSLNMYDFGARWYDVAGVPMWTSVDPLAEKYYNITPYAYCNNNPVNRVDPYGETDYTVNSDGYMYESTSFMEKVKSFIGIGSNQDRVYLEGSNKLIVSLPEGAINLSEDENEITKVEISDNKSAEKFTDAVMKETDVEWARVEHGNNKTVSNTIQNNHDDRNVNSVVPTMESYRAKGETIYLFDHSHPIPKNIKGTNAEGLIKINVSLEDKNTVAKYKPNISRVMNKQTNKIEYYNSKGVYRYENWK